MNSEEYSHWSSYAPGPSYGRESEEGYFRRKTRRGDNKSMGGLVLGVLFLLFLLWLLSQFWKKRAPTVTRTVAKKPISLAGPAPANASFADILASIQKNAINNNQYSPEIQRALSSANNWKLVLPQDGNRSFILPKDGQPNSFWQICYDQGKKTWTLIDPHYSSSYSHSSWNHNDRDYGDGCYYRRY